MYAKISKSKILDFLLENDKVVSQDLIEKIFDYFCEKEQAEFEFTTEVRKKIKSSLVLVNRKWSEISRNKIARKNYLITSKSVFIEFNLTLKTNNESNMEIDEWSNQPIEQLLEDMTFYR